MKKIILFVLSLCLIIPSVFCQITSKERHDTLYKTSVSKDTSVFRLMKGEQIYFEFEITTFTDGDTLTIGYSTDKTFISPIDDRFPMIITKATYKSNVNGTIKYRIAVEGRDWPAKYIGFRIRTADTSGKKPSWHWAT